MLQDLGFGNVALVIREGEQLTSGSRTIRTDVGRHRNLEVTVVFDTSLAPVFTIRWFVKNLAGELLVTQEVREVHQRTWNPPAETVLDWIGRHLPATKSAAKTPAKPPARALKAASSKKRRPAATS